jgi:outer membrane receptor for ferrienterochelin and colicins
MTKPTRSLCALLALLALPLAAANAADLKVTVRDNYGVLPGASAWLTRDGTGRGVGQLADAAGVAGFTGLAAGSYELRVSLAGFADASRKGVAVAEGETTALDVTLSQVQFSTTVTVTTASRREQLLLDVAQPTSLIDAAEIADTGASTAKDLLLDQAGSGVQVNAGGGQGYLSINGIPNSGVLVLVDGRRYLGKDSNGNLNLEDLPLGGIERVEVVKGPGSALYGADALGGVVNFITRRSRTPGATNTLSLSGGSYGDFRGSDNFGWRGARGGFAVSAGYRTYDGFDLDQKNPQTIGQPPSRFYNADFAGDLQITDRLTGRLLVDYSRRNIDNYFFSGATQLATTVYDSQRKLTRYGVSPELELQAGARTSFNLSWNLGEYQRDETRVYPQPRAGVPAVQPQPPWKESNNELKLTGRHAWSLGGREHPLQVGYEFRREKLSRGSLSKTDPERDINVLWAQQEVVLGKYVTLTGGFRYDDYSDFGHEWSPKASLLIAPAEGHRLRASYGHGFRPPYFGEMFLSTPPFFVGNPDLVPEKTNGFSGGYAYAGSKLQFSADYFSTELTNGIVFNLSKLPYTYGNLSKYTSKGVSLSASVALPAGFTPSVAYTYNKREDDKGVEIGGYPRHAASAKLQWASPRLGLRANLRAEINGEVPPSATDGSYQPAYNVWYAQVSKRLALRGPYALSLFAQLSNLFDEKDIFRRDKNGQPVQGEYQVWIAPRTLLGGITVEMDWTR